jgi:riboflavin biosynthesis pyrimidine reductase
LESAQEGLPEFDVLFDDAQDGRQVRGYRGDPRWTGVAANFVESLDGVTALPDAGLESGAIISGGSRADHFLMGLLRSVADAILIGAGTLRAGSKDVWFADSIFPEGAQLFAEIGRLRAPLDVVSRSGRIDPGHPALRSGGVVLQGSLSPGEILGRLRADGHQRILCEGGPSLFAELAAAGAVDELFLTLSPRLFGRMPADGRKSLTDRQDLHGAALSLRSVRRSGSHLFLRYRRP